LQTIAKRQEIKIGCPKEAALRIALIGLARLKSLTPIFRGDCPASHPGATQ
jgi:hypothetical protein